MFLPSTLVTVSGLIAAFCIFLLMALKEVRTGGLSAVRNLKFQLAVATFIWLFGESLSFYYVMAYGIYAEFLDVHTISMAIFALIILTRLPRFLKH